MTRAATPNHDRMITKGPYAAPLSVRFEENTIPEPNSGCWLWLGAYGFPLGVPRPRITVKKKIMVAARVSFELHKGPIPTGLWILHTCHNTHCVNPDHLYAGTPKQNTGDMMRAGRHFSQDDNNPAALAALKDRMAALNAKRRARTHCKRGHALSGENLMIVPTGRACRACRGIYNFRSYGR